MKNLFFIILIGLSVSCANDDKPNHNSGRIESSQVYKGEPKDFNGQWTGPGKVTVNGQSTDHKFEIFISETPSGVDLHCTVFNLQGESVQQISLTGHRVEGNKIFDKRDNAQVGEIGEGGLYLARQGSGRLDLVVGEEGTMKLVATLENRGQVIKYEGDLKKQ